jgi:hypothetical protein
MAVHIPVLVEPLKEGTGFRATSGELFDTVGEGATEEEAVQNFQTAVAARLNQGAAKVITVELPGETQAKNPWLALAGIFKDDPLFDEWQEAIREYRKSVDQAEGIR